MSIWKGVASVATAFARWTTKMEIAAAKKKVKEPLSYAAFHNTMHAFSGEVGKLFDTSGGILKQHIDRCISDLGVVLDELFTKRLDEAQIWVETTLNLWTNSITNVMKGYFDAHNGASEARHQEAESRRQASENRIYAAINGIAGYLHTIELNNSNRYLELQKFIEREGIADEERFNILMNSMGGFYASAMEEIQRKQRVVTEFKVMPTFEWLMDHPDEVIRLGDAFKGMKENAYPADHAMRDALMAFRSMMPCENSVLELRKKIAVRCNNWQQLAA